MSDQDYLDQFTERAKKVLSLAEEEARRFNHTAIGTEHLLLGMIGEGQGLAVKVLSQLDVEPDIARNAVELLIRRGDQQMIVEEIALTLHAQKAIDLAVDEAQRLGHHYVGTEHLLLGLLREHEGMAAGVLENLGVKLEKARAQTIEALDYALGRANVHVSKVSHDTLRRAEELPPALAEAIKELEAILDEKDTAITRQEYQLAAELRGREVTLRDHIARLEANWRREQKHRQSF